MYFVVYKIVGLFSCLKHPVLCGVKLIFDSSEVRMHRKVYIFPRLLLVILLRMCIKPEVGIRVSAPTASSPIPTMVICALLGADRMNHYSVISLLVKFVIAWNPQQWVSIQSSML